MGTHLQTPLISARTCVSRALELYCPNAHPLDPAARSAARCNAVALPESSRRASGGAFGAERRASADALGWPLGAPGADRTARMDALLQQSPRGHDDFVSSGDRPDNPGHRQRQSARPRARHLRDRQARARRAGRCRTASLRPLPRLPPSRLHRDRSGHRRPSGRARRHGLDALLEAPQEGPRHAGTPQEGEHQVAAGPASCGRDLARGAEPPGGVPRDGSGRGRARELRLRLAAQGHGRGARGARPACPGRSRKAVPPVSD